MVSLEDSYDEIEDSWENLDQGHSVTLGPSSLHLWKPSQAKPSVPERGPSSKTASKTSVTSLQQEQHGNQPPARLHGAAPPSNPGQTNAWTRGDASSESNTERPDSISSNSQHHTKSWARQSAGTSSTSWRQTASTTTPSADDGWTNVGPRRAKHARSTRAPYFAAYVSDEEYEQYLQWADGDYVEGVVGAAQHLDEDPEDDAYLTALWANKLTGTNTTAVSSGGMQHLSALIGEPAAWAATDDTASAGSMTAAMTLDEQEPDYSQQQEDFGAQYAALPTAWDLRRLTAATSTSSAGEMTESGQHQHDSAEPEHLAWHGEQQAEQQRQQQQGASNPAAPKSVADHSHLRTHKGRAPQRPTKAGKPSKADGLDSWRRPLQTEDASPEDVLETTLSQPEQLSASASDVTTFHQPHHANDANATPVPQLLGDGTVDAASQHSASVSGQEEYGAGSTLEQCPSVPGSASEPESGASILDISSHLLQLPDRLQASPKSSFPGLGQLLGTERNPVDLLGQKLEQVHVSEAGAIASRSLAGLYDSSSALAGAGRGPTPSETAAQPMQPHVAHYTSTTSALGLSAGQGTSMALHSQLYPAQANYMSELASTSHVGSQQLYTSSTHADPQQLWTFPQQHTSHPSIQPTLLGGFASGPPGGGPGPGLEVPSYFKCPISSRLLIDPVVACDGYSYDRETYDQLVLSGILLSPMTGHPLDPPYAWTNTQLKEALHAWLATQRLGPAAQAPSATYSHLQAHGPGSTTSWSSFGQGALRLPSGSVGLQAGPAAPVVAPLMMGLPGALGMMCNRYQPPLQGQ